MVKFLIKRPVAVIMTTLALLILGGVTLNLIPVSLMPDVEIPRITIQVESANLSAREMEDGVIKPLRNALLRLHQLEDIKSETTNGSGQIHLEFAYDTAIDYSFIEVNEKVDRAMNALPRDLERPRVIKANASDIPVFYMHLTQKEENSVPGSTSGSKDLIAFNRFADQVIRKRVEQLPEVAMVDISGIVGSEIMVIPDMQKLMALKMDVSVIENAIRRQQVAIGNLIVRDNQYQYSLRLGNSLSGVEDLRAVYIHYNNRVFQLKDLAEVHEQLRERRGQVLANGKEAIALAVIKQSDARMSDLKTSLHTLVTQMESDYPLVEFGISRDQTQLLDLAVSNLGQSLLWGMLLAFVMLFLFLKNRMAPVLIGISIPVSVIICMLAFYLLDMSLNVISLSGLVLGVGLMIDNAIIVIDNITQYRERGHALSKSCVLGTREVIRPLLSSALTTCSVFLPLIFLNGLTGALFYDQAMAVTIGLMTSFFVSITLIPVLYRVLHTGRKKEGRVQSSNPSIPVYFRWYKKGFKTILRNPKTAFTGFALLCLVTMLLFQLLPKSQMPELTETEAMITIDWNEPIPLEENRSRVEGLLQPVVGELLFHSTELGIQQFLLHHEQESHPAMLRLYVKASTPEDLQRVKRHLSSVLAEMYRTATITMTPVDNLFNMIFGSIKPPITASIFFRGQEENQRESRLTTLYDSLASQLGTSVIPPVRWEDKLVVQANTEHLYTYGLDSDRLYNTLKSAFNENSILKLSLGQEQVPVVVGSGRTNVREVIRSTNIRAGDSAYYPVSVMVDLDREKTLRTITAGREGEYYPMDVFVDDDEATETEMNIRNAIQQFPGQEVAFDGQIYENRKLVKELFMVLILTLFLLYFILASQFESLALPFIILLEVPLAMAGSFGLLYLSGMSLNLMSMTGIVVMTGIIINDSILKIDTIIQLRRQGVSLLKALLVAGHRRLKPILMTSLTTILALVPMLLSEGIGAELQAPLALALIGGILVGTLVSLYFVPLCYYLLVKKNNHV
ncbi:efflux RND transporter permease subunit [Robertkochia sediminum]|uniref:efflux RND transporter permease subunit n=1 Tax=Robertkochia sediminum TaxID=2785326 RepID=UPI0019347EF3|nr:efflux RND transporter permease subunit [Robertkochia sediminum]MBL7473291.1 efflux RND transporter permease subunit [Robertkochia sediminum]